MKIIGYKKLSEDAIAPTIAYDSSDDTMGIDVYTNENVLLLSGSAAEIAAQCPHSSKGSCSCHPHASILPYANIPTGIALDLPSGVHVSWGGRSGLAFKGGRLPFEGKIDSNYRGELAVKIWSMNPDDNMEQVKAGTKIAQLYVVEYTDQYKLGEVFRFTEDSARGSDGFGSTGH